MKKVTSLCLMMVLGLWGTSYASQKSEWLKKGRPAQAESRPIQIIVKFKPQAVALGENPTIQSASVTALNKKHSLNKTRNLRRNRKMATSNIQAAQAADHLDHVYLLEFDSNKDINQLLKEYRSDPDVEYAEENRVFKPLAVPNDPQYGTQWAPKKINLEGAWDIETGKSSVVVAVIDTGIDDTHPDLINNLWVNADEIAGNYRDDDGNGYIDDTNGYDIANMMNDISDIFGHGTHVSGIIGAMGNNSVGVAGAAWTARIMTVGAADMWTSYFYEYDIADALIYAVDNGARIINCSFGMEEDSQLVRNAVAYAVSQGKVVVGAAGNEGNNFVLYPAAYPSVIAVASTDQSDLRSVWTASLSSNYGTRVDVSAPGTSVLSTLPTYWLSDSIPLNYGSFSGTSMATPYVSGLAALLLSKDSSLSLARVTELIKNNADNINALNPAYTGQLGTGRINAFRSLSALAPPTDTTPPVISGIQVTNITHNQARVGWGTDEISDSQVEYGLNISYGNSSVIDPAMSQGHGIILSGLNESTLYHFRVKSRDTAGNLSVSGDNTFSTVAPPDTTPPVITDVYAWNIGATRATIRWTTDEMSDSRVEYGPTESYGETLIVDSIILTSHGPEITGLTGGTLYHYRVSSRDSAGNIGTSGDYTFTTKSAPVITIQPTDQVVNMGERATFNISAVGDPAPTYQWRANERDILGATGPSFTTPPVTYADNNVRITCVVSNSYGSIVSNIAMLGVILTDISPYITEQPENQTVLEGQTAIFDIVANGSPLPTYQWRKNGVDLTGPGSQSAIYTIPATTLADSGAVFTCVVTNRLGSVISSDAVLTVNPVPAAPTITIQPTGQSVLVGQTATFNISATGYPAPTYQWTRNGVIISGANGTSYTTPVTVIGDNGALFRCVVTNTQGSVISDAATLTVSNPVAPSITQQPTNQSVNVGQTATFNITAAGNPTPTYQWRRNTVNISGATNASYTTPATTIADNGASYTCVVTNSQGSVISNPGILTVTVARGQLQLSAATYTAPENSGNVTITVNRVNGSDGVVTVTYATREGTARAGVDYAGIPGANPSPTPSPTPAPTNVLTFANGETRKTFYVTLFNNASYSGSRSFNLLLSNPTGGATLGTPAEATFTITDDESPTAFLPFDSDFIPLNGEQVTIRYNLGAALVTRLSIENPTGQAVRVLVNSQTQTVGNHDVIWDGRGTDGAIVPAGTYYARLQAGTFNQTVPITVGGGIENPTTFLPFDNEFNPGIGERMPIVYVLGESVVARLSIEDAFRQPVKVLLNEQQIIGSHMVMWDGTNTDGTIVPSGLYWVRLQAGSFDSSVQIRVISAGGAGESTAQDDFEKFFNVTSGPMAIAFHSSLAQSAKLTVYDLQGRQVRKLMDDTALVGSNPVLWDGRNDSGEKVAPDVYLLKLDLKNHTRTKKVSILR